MVDLNTWVAPANEFAALCDLASQVLASPEGRNDPRLDPIAVELTTVLRTLDSLPCPPGNTGKAIAVLTNIAAHSTNEVLVALARLKRLGGMQGEAPIALSTPPDRSSKRPATKRRQRNASAPVQQPLWDAADMNRATQGDTQ